jgi:hypothetical protein
MKADTCKHIWTPVLGKPGRYFCPACHRVGQQEKTGVVMQPAQKKAWRWNCEFSYKDKAGVEYKGKGRSFDVNGITIELFPSGVLCEMLHRTRACLYVWEKEYGFPPALWRVEDEGRKNRWYSRRQLIGIRTVYEQFGRLGKKNYGDLPKFIAAVRSFFYTIDRPTEKR